MVVCGRLEEETVEEEGEHKENESLDGERYKQNIRARNNHILNT